MPDGACRSPVDNGRNEGFTHQGPQQLAVLHPRQFGSSVRVDDDDADAHGPGEGTASHLVAAGNQLVALGRKLALPLKGGSSGCHHCPAGACWAEETLELLASGTLVNTSG